MPKQQSKMTTFLTTYTLTALAVVASGCDKDEAEGEAEARAYGIAVAQEFAALHAEVERNHSPIDACFAAALADKPGFAGRLPLNFRLDADGKVIDVGLEDETIGAAVGACVKDVAASWRIARASDEPTNIAVSVNFGPVEPAPEPVAIAATTDVTKMTSEGALDPDLIRRIVVAHISEIRYCYNEALAKDPALVGEVVARFTISGSGKITTPVAIDGTTGDATMDACIATAVGRWLFPKPAGGGEVVVNYPFAFSPG